jgi:DUF4097 and DUF4098 domain-containing protein YvlB
LEVETQQTPEGLKLVYRPPDSVGILVSRGGPDSISFTIRVPADTAVKLSSGLGKIDLSGTRGAAILSSRFGDITAQNVSRALSVESRNADLTVEHIQAGGSAIHLATTFGNIKTTDLAGGEIEITTANGSISAQQIESPGNLIVKNSFGEIHLGNATSEMLNVENHNGDIQVEASKITGPLKVSSTFSSISVTETSATEYTLKTNNGELTLDGASGRLDLENRDGAITILNAERSILNLSTNNGKVSFSGTLDAGSEQRIENRFGDIDLTIPESSAFNFSLSTQFGKINSELPLTIAGEISDTKWSATLNGGGPLIQVSTNNGDIHINKLPDQP